VTGSRTGTKDEDNRYFVDSRWPDILSSLAGIQISESTLLRPAKSSDEGADYTPAATNSIASAASDWSGTYSAREWADILEAHGGQPIFNYTRDYFAGKPAVTLNRVGKGQLVYLGSNFDRQFREMLSEHLLGTVPSVPRFRVQPGIEIDERRGPQDHLLFVLNFSAEPKTVLVPGQWMDALTGNVVNGSSGGRANQCACPT
jgi:beta-galactosidase